MELEELEQLEQLVDCFWLEPLIPQPNQPPMLVVVEPLKKNTNLGGAFKQFFSFTSIRGEMIQFEEHIFEMGGSTTN